VNELSLTSKHQYAPSYPITASSIASGSLARGGTLDLTNWQ